MKALSGWGIKAKGANFAFVRSTNPHLQIQAPPPYKKEKGIAKKPFSLKSLCHANNKNI